MRRLTGFFVIALTSSVALGQPARSPEPKSVASVPGIPLQVVQTLPKTHQAVVFEKNRATHVLIEVGGTIDGFRVDAITDTQVVLSVRGSQIALTAPKRPAPVLLTPATPPTAPVDPYGASATAPADPYSASAAPADPYGASAAPTDPYGEPEIHTATATDVRTAEAPVATAAPAPTVASAPAPSAPTTTTTTTTTTPAAATPTVTGSSATTTTPTVATPAPTTATPTPAPPAPTTPTATAAPTPTVETAPAPTVATGPTPTVNAPVATSSTPPPTTTAPLPTPPAPRVASSPGADLAAAATGSTLPVGPTASDTKLTRSEVRVALADFGRLMSAIRGEFTPVGAKIDGVTDRSVFAKVGLKTGDIVTAVDGKPILTIDDAAELYSHATTARNLTVSLLRAGKPATLKVSIQ